jgi:DNA-binding beta-propeller fold protein YncE
VVRRLPAGQTPVDVTLNEGGKIAYVSNLFGTDAVTVIDTQNYSVIQTITLPGPALAQGAAVTPDGKTLYVALRGVSGVLAVNTDSPSTRSCSRPTTWKPSNPISTERTRESSSKVEHFGSTASTTPNILLFIAGRVLENANPHAGRQHLQPFGWRWHVAGLVDGERADR